MDRPGPKMGTDAGTKETDFSSANISIRHCALRSDTPSV
jgi:hypothetical protein